MFLIANWSVSKFKINVISHLNVYSAVLKPLLHSDKHHKVRTTSCKILSNSMSVVADVVKVYDIINFHVHTTLLLCRCQVLTASNTFILV